jgi:hypothetical protein
VISAGQTNSVKALPQPVVNGPVEPLQETGSTQKPTTFHTEARQVLLGAKVMRRKPDSREPDESLIPRDAAKHFPPYIYNSAVAVANRLDDALTGSSFRVFDNGAEQHINYFKKLTSPLEDIKGLWVFAPGNSGTWGFPPTDARYSFQEPEVKYVIGYVPPPLEAGKCHDVRVTVDKRDVRLDRNQYCIEERSDNLADAIRERTEVGEKMRIFADSEPSGSLKIWAQAFTFWSAGVLSLVTKNLAREDATPPKSDLTYVVEVHDSTAPASVHVAVEFVPPWNHWDADCRGNPALYVLGIVYKGNHEVAGQFGDVYRCTDPARWHEELLSFFPVYVPPTRFDVQIALTPGDYDLRVVVSDGKKHFGKLRFPLHVEWFDGQRLAISDVVLSRSPRDASKVLEDAISVSPGLLNPTPLVSKNAQFIPGTEVLVHEHDRLPVYFEIYEPLLKTQTTEIQTHVRITNLTTGSVVRDSGAVSAADYVLPGNPVIPLGLSVGTDGLAKGDYRVEVQASDGAGRQSEWRESRFTIN